MTGGSNCGVLRTIVSQADSWRSLGQEIPFSWIHHEDLLDLVVALAGVVE